MVGAKSGRMSQTNPDLQTIPGRPDLVKDLYTCAREEFYQLYVTYDFEWQQMPEEEEKNDKD